MKRQCGHDNVAGETHLQYRMVVLLSKGIFDLKYLGSAFPFMLLLGTRGVSVSFAV